MGSNPTLSAIPLDTLVNLLYQQFMTARPAYRKIRTYIESLYSGSPLVLAVSGGVDSIWMVDFVNGCDVPFIIAHFQHNLRDKAEQDKDLKAVMSIAEQLNIRVHVGSCPVDIIEESKQSRIGIEAVARMHRYKFLTDIAGSFRPTSPILLAHHADDQVETVLLNLMRGLPHTHLAMRKENTEANVFRPFMSVHKQDIINQATARKLVWNEDVTNHDVDYDRNWIRNVVIPKLSERRNITKSILSGVTKTINNIA